MCSDVWSFASSGRRRAMKRLVGLFLLSGSMCFPLIASAVPPVEFAPKTDFATGTNPRSVAMGDLNVDGKLDLVVTDFGAFPMFDNVVSVLLGNGDGTFGPRSDIATGYAPLSVAIGDVNKDGKPDMMVGEVFGNHVVYVYPGNGDGSFGSPTGFPI